MMQKSIIIEKSNKDIIGNICITGSKSESNRLLILQALYPDKIYIKNISDADDTKIMKKAILSNNNIIDINHAGTAMRFLTAYFCTKYDYKIILTGSQRMKERPIKILVEALQSLGAKINYLEKEGYPPIQIIGRNLLGGEIQMNAQISSQYISALMLIGSSFEKGLSIFLTGNITSYPYILMTYNILKKIGIKILWNNNKITIFYSSPNKHTFDIESDWTSASYYYSLAAVSKNCNITLSKYKKNSLQGDHSISKIYNIFFGVKTIFRNNEIILKKKLNHIMPNTININLNKNPDIAQTISVTCAILKIKCFLYGLETLKIKETDRLYALKKELYKIGVNVNIDEESIDIKDFNSQINNHEIIINTYNDHRMAMSFSPIALLFPIIIKNPDVVTKSYPNFWVDLERLNFCINKK